MHSPFSLITPHETSTTNIVRSVPEINHMMYIMLLGRIMEPNLIERLSEHYSFSLLIKASNDLVSVFLFLFPCIIQSIFPLLVDH